MTTTRTTARAEIYDAATDNGFDVKVDEGVDMHTGSQFNRVTVRVTRFVITRKPEFDHLRIIGTQRSYTVVFSETGAFIRAWQFYGDPEFQPWYTRRRNITITKGALLVSLASDNPERLIALKEKFDAERQAHYTAKINEAQVAETNAKVARIAAYSTAVEYVRTVIKDSTGGTEISTFVAGNILDAILEGEAITNLVNTRTAHHSAGHTLTATKAEATALGLEV